MVRIPEFLADSPWLDQLLERLPSTEIGVFGDLCLDAYWMLEEAVQRVSLETGLPVHLVRRERYSLGGAGNVAANLAALGVGKVRLIGMVGNDVFGHELMAQLAAHDLPTEAILRPAGWRTAVYVKPCRGSQELNRFDFGTKNAPDEETLRAIAERMERAAKTCSIIVINQQVAGGWRSELVSAVAGLIERHLQVLFIVDSRDHAASFPGAALKLNLREAAKVHGTEGADADQGHALARVLSARQNRPVMITRGEHGLVTCRGEELCDLPGVELSGPVDAVGAGDTALAGFAAALAAGAPLLEAGAFANLAAAITTRQILTTGLATPALLRAVGPAPDYIHAPRLASLRHLAEYADGTNIEVVSRRRPGARIRHAIFDHDGTISTLRQGWEAIMEPLMVKAILGPSLAGCDEATHARVVATVRAFIDRTTGIQTLAQMKGLVGLVRDMGHVAPADILDEHGYKAIYNEELLRLVRGRMRQLEQGELARGDWEIKNAFALLERLNAAGVTLYLASGTDEADVIHEARAMGYAHLFAGGIHGAVGDINVEAKRVVLERIINAGHLGGQELVVFGDGPVEIREGRRRGALTVGIASDEVRRHGLDPRKRTRLIRAGADIIIPDFSQMNALLQHLGLDQA